MNVKPNTDNATPVDDLRSRHLKPVRHAVAEDALSRLRDEAAFGRRQERAGHLLFKMAPGAVLPDHEHVLIEQTYVLDGSLVDKEGPDAGIEVGPGEFVWRPAGSRHTAWAPKGGTFIAMFQIPNKFFEQDGRVVDAAGKDWDQAWGSLLAK